MGREGGLARWKGIPKKERSALAKRIAALPRPSRRPKQMAGGAPIPPAPEVVFPTCIKGISRGNQERHKKKVRTILTDYYAQDGNGAWLLTSSEVAEKHGYKQVSGIAPFVRRYGHGTRREVGEGTALNGVGLYTGRSMMVRRLMNEQLFRYALTSPRVLGLVSEVVKGLASSMGVSRPSPQELAVYLGKVAK